MGSFSSSLRKGSTNDLQKNYGLGNSTLGNNRATFDGSFQKQKLSSDLQFPVSFSAIAKFKLSESSRERHVFIQVRAQRREICLSKMTSSWWEGGGTFEGKQMGQSYFCFVFAVTGTLNPNGPMEKKAVRSCHLNLLTWLDPSTLFLTTISISPANFLQEFLFSFKVLPFPTSGFVPSGAQSCGSSLFSLPGGDDQRGVPAMPLVSPTKFFFSIDIDKH